MKRFGALLLAVVVSMTSIPVNAVPVYALESDTETGSVILDDGILSEPEEAEALNEPEGADDPVVLRSEETSVSEDKADAGMIIDGEAPEDGGQMVVGGYIEMPWDNNTPVVSKRLDYNEAIENIVDDSTTEEGDGREIYILDPDTYVTEPESLEDKYPASTDEEILTYLKNKYPATRSQSPYGSCWAHSSIALSEFYMISHKLSDNTSTVDNDVNYSELQLAYFCYNQAADPVNGDTGDRVSFDKTKGRGKSYMDFGGNLDFSSQSLMRYNGVVEDDGEAAYSNARTVLGRNPGLDPEYSSSHDTAHLKNVYHINIKENPRLVKQAIKENGIVGVSIYADEKYINNATNAYYNYVDEETNHAVAVVGWDDNYSVSNFKTTPGDKGAWLVRNSWTTTSSYSFYSYFWLSYKDTSLSDTAYVFEMADNNRGEYYENNYNYDSQLHANVEADSKKVANVYTAVKNSETLKAVQIDSAMRIPGDYTVKIYKNLSNSSNPESGTEAATAKGTLPFAGRYTIPLNTAVELTEGETFSVVVETVQNAIDQECDFTWVDQVNMDTAINEGESFIYKNGKWTDLFGKSYNGKYGNICIRALTDTNEASALPESITSLSVKGKTEQSVTLVWSAAKDATGYEIWYSTSENGTYIKKGQTSASAKKYKCEGLEAGTTYYFKVYPIKGGSRYEAGVSPVVSVTTSAAIPAVEVVNIGRYTATVRWDKLENCTGYHFVFKQEGQEGSYGGHTSDNQVELRLDPGKKYWVKVCSYTGQTGSEEYGSYSEEIEFTTNSGEGSAVTNLKAEPYYTNMVKLSWDEQDEASYYTIMKSENGTDFESFGPYNPMTSYYAENLDSDKEYSFKVIAGYEKFGGYDEYPSGIVSSYTMLPPTSVTSATASNDSISIEWTGGEGASHYSVFRKERSASEYVPLAVVPASGGMTYTDNTALPGRVYAYRVNGCRTNKLTDTQGLAYNSKEAYIRLKSVDGLVVSNIGASTATLTWGAINGAQGYVISENVSGDQWVETARVDANCTSYTLEGLTPDTLYVFAVRAFTDYMTGGGTGEFFTTLAGSPAAKSFFTVTNLSATYNGGYQEASVTCSNEEVAAAGFSVLYGRKLNGVVSSYSSERPAETGEYQIKIVTNASTNYTATELTDESWVFVISPKPVTNLTVTLFPSSFTYSGSECKPTVTVKDGDTLLKEGYNYTLTYSDNTYAGTGYVKITQKTGGFYKFDEITKSFSIGKAETTVTIAGGNKSVTYGDAGFTLSATAAVPGSGDRTWTWSSSDESVATVDEGTGDVTIKKSGSAEITAAYSSNDTQGSGTMTLTVNKAPLKVTAKDNTITYGDEPAGNGVTYSGFVNGETAEGLVALGLLWGSLGYTYDYSQHGDVGNSYSITPSGLDATNYDITYVPGKLTVTPKEVGLQWSETSLTYNGEAQKPSATAAGLVNGDSCTVTVTTSTQAINAGSYTATAASLSNTNYKLPAVKTTSFTIGKASYGNKPASASARYGNSGVADLSSYIVSGGSLKTSGITTSDTNSVLNGTPSVTGSKLAFAFVDDSSNVNKTATVTVGVNGGTNYEDYTIAVTLTVLDKGAQSVTFSGVTDGKVVKTYGDADFTKTASASGTIEYTSSNPSVAKVGTYNGEVTILNAGETTIIAKAAATDAYAAGSASYVLTVGKKEIGITWSDTSFFYDKTTHVPTATATGLKEGDTCSLTVSGEQTNEGTYNATVTDLDNPNYKLPSAVTKSFTINKAAVTVSGITASDKVYDETTEAELNCESATFTGLKSGDTLTVTATGVFADENAGTGKQVNISNITLGGASAANYDLIPNDSQKTTTASITQRPVTVKALDQTVALNGSIINSASKAELTGAVSGHTLYSVTLTASSTANVTTGGTITPSAAVIKNGNKVVTDNYSFTYTPGVLTVTKAVPSITAPTAKNLTYNGQGQSLVNAGSSPAGTTMTYSFSKDGAYEEAVPIGIEARTYTVWYKVDGGSNYSDLAPQSVEVTIRKASLTGANVVLGPALTYSGAVQTQNVSRVTVNGETIPSSEYTVTGNTGLNAGNYTLTVTAVNDSNCTGSIQKTFTISRKDINPVVTVTGTYTYTGSAITPEYTVTDGTNALAASDFTAVISDNVNAGQGKIKISAKNGGNYSFEELTQSFTISKAQHEDVNLTGSAMYGTSATLSLSAGIESGAAPGTVTVESDVNSVLDGTPTVSGSILNYSFKNKTTDAEMTAVIKVAVTGADNYEDYYIIATVTARNKMDAEVTISGGNKNVTYGVSNFTLSGRANKTGAHGAWTWKSSNSSVATITNAGVVTVKGVGTSTITAKYESDTTAGEATILLTVGKKSLSITWSNTSVTYDGTSHQPTATISGVVSGDVCTVSVSGSGINAGSYTATAALNGTSKDNYELPADKKSCTFTINKASIGSAVITLGSALTYTGSEQTQTVTKVELGTVNITSYCDISNNKATNAGNYTLTVTAKSNSNYTGTATKAFTIAKKAVTPTVTVTGAYAYTGRAITPTYTVKVGSDTLAASEYTANVTDNVNAGNGKITITPSSAGNYTFDAITKTFTIAKATHEDATASGEAKYGLGGSVALASLIEEGGRLGTVSLSDPSGIVEGKPALSGTTLSYSFKNDPDNAGKKATVTVPVTGSKNYLDYSIKVTLTVIACEHAHTEIRDKKDATCTQQGYSGDKYCLDCGNIIEKGTNTPADPSNHSYDAGVITTQPTILEEGVKTYTCVRCHHTYTEPVARLEDEEDHSDLIEDITGEDGKTQGEVKTEKKEDGSTETTVKVGDAEVEKIITKEDGETIVETNIWVGGLQSGYTYTGSAIKPDFHVYDGTKRLSASSDYSVSYNDNKNAGTAEITIKFKGNYKGTSSETVNFTISKINLGKCTVPDIAINSGKKPSFSVTAANGLKVPEKAYSVTYESGADLKEAGEYTATFTAKDTTNYEGTATATVTVVGKNDKNRNLANGTISVAKKVTWTGKALEPAVTVKDAGKRVVDPSKYEVAYINNVEVGTATVVVTANDSSQDGYVGAKSATFKIVNGKGEVECSVEKSAEYSPAGAKAAVTVTDKDSGDVLKEGTDYTLKYSKNTAVTTTAEVKITGKGRYKFNETRQFAVTAKDIKKAAFTATDVMGAKNWNKTKVTGTDGGRNLAKREFEITGYTVNGSPATSAGEGSEVTVEIKAKGSNYTGTTSATYHVIAEANNIGKAKVSKKIGDKVYNGGKVTLADKDLTGVLTLNGRTLVPGTDFEVIGYSNNNKKGTAKVTVAGKANGTTLYGGTKTLSFKIVEKSADWKQNGKTFIDGEWK